MGTNYEHLTAAERSTLMVMQAEGASQRAVAAHLGRSPSTLNRELARNRAGHGPDVGHALAPYDAVLADQRARALLQAPGRSLWRHCFSPWCTTNCVWAGRLSRSPERSR